MKINLIQFSQDFQNEYKEKFWKLVGNGVAARGRKVQFADNLSNSDFELAIMDNIIHWANYDRCHEYPLLNSFFKNGGKLENTQYFLDNIEKFKSQPRTRGCDLVYSYVKNVLKKRLPPELESKFLTGLWGSYHGSRVIYKYAKYVVRNRLPVEYEVGCQDLDYLNFVRTKGHDIAEILITNSTLCYCYYKKFYCLPDMAHNYMMAMQMSDDYMASLYFKHRAKDDKIIKSRLSMLDKTKTIEEILRDFK